VREHDDGAGADILVLDRPRAQFDLRHAHLLVCLSETCAQQYGPTGHHRRVRLVQLTIGDK
jgi:hypothetical protein